MSAGLLNFTSRTISASNSGGDAGAGIRILADGRAQTDINATYTDIPDEWLTLGDPAAFEVRATLQGGDTPSGTLGTWLSLETFNRAWFVNTSQSPAANNKGCTLLIEIREAMTGVVRASATITLSASTDIYGSPE